MRIVPGRPDDRTISRARRDDGLAPARRSEKRAGSMGLLGGPRAAVRDGPFFVVFVVVVPTAVVRALVAASVLALLFF